MQDANEMDIGRRYETGMGMESIFLARFENEDDDEWSWSSITANDDADANPTTDPPSQKTYKRVNHHYERIESINLDTSGLSFVSLELVEEGEANQNFGQRITQNALRAFQSTKEYRDVISFVVGGINSTLGTNKTVVIVGVSLIVYGAYAARQLNRQGQVLTAIQDWMGLRPDDSIQNEPDTELTQIAATATETHDVSRDDLEWNT